MLVLNTPLAVGCENFNCLVLDMPDGSRVRVWLTPGGKQGRVRCVIDAARDVIVTRGKLLGDDARGPVEVSRR